MEVEETAHADHFSDIRGGAFLVLQGFCLLERLVDAGDGLVKRSVSAPGIQRRDGALVDLLGILAGTVLDVGVRTEFISIDGQFGDQVQLAAAGRLEISTVDRIGKIRHGFDGSLGGNSGRRLLIEGLAGTQCRKSEYSVEYLFHIGIELND